jgi:hypothetical protein
MPVPRNLSSRFKLAGQTDMPKNGDELIVGVRRSGQGREIEKVSRSHEVATITPSVATATATINTSTTGSSSSPSSNSNGGSFYFMGGSCDDVDQGFEVVGFASTPTPTKTTCSPVQEEDDCDEDGDDAHDDSSSSAHSSSTELDLQVNKINVSDIELMRDFQNPGVLRLTAEGLQSHERQSFQKAVRMHGRGGNGSGNENNTYEQWRRAKLQQKWHREKHNERQEKLTDQNIRIRQSLQQKQQQQLRESTTDSKRKQAGTDHTDKRTQKGGGTASKKLLVAIKSTFAKDDVEGVSLAPLNMMENETLDLKIKVDEVAPTKVNKFGIFGLFRSKSSDVSATASALLQKERQAATEAHTQKKLHQQRERQRIERKRQAYLENERMKESVTLTPSPKRVFSEPLPGLLGDGDWI